MSLVACFAELRVLLHVAEVRRIDYFQGIVVLCHADFSDDGFREGFWRGSCQRRKRLGVIHDFCDANHLGKRFRLGNLLLSVAENKE